jgi:hypothetical protein
MFKTKENIKKLERRIDNLEGDIYQLKNKDKALEDAILLLLDHFELEYYHPDCKPKLKEKNK